LVAKIAALLKVFMEIQAAEFKFSLLNRFPSIFTFLGKGNFRFG
jgi:hypothetical protein